MTMTASNPSVPNLLLRNPILAGKPKRTIKSYDQIGRKDEEAVIRLYDQLAPDARDRVVDIELIVTKGFPVFEEVLGTAGWNKIRHCFGIGVKTASKNIRHEEIESLISKLRTIENAQYYLYGYQNLLKEIAALVGNAPEGTSVLTKVKVVRLFFLIYSAYHFFQEDFAYSMITKKGYISFPQAMKNNKSTIYPEQLFFMQKTSLTKCSAGGILYDAIAEEVRLLDKKIRKEVLELAELKLDENGNFVSVNTKPIISTYGKVRDLKTKMFRQLGYFPAELYVITDMWKDIEFGELYNAYKMLKRKDFESFDVHTRSVPHVEGNRFMEKSFEFKIIAPAVEMSCKEEAERFCRFVEYLAKNNFAMPIDLVNDKAETYRENIEIGKFFAFLKFAYDVKYLDPDESIIDEDFGMYFTLIHLENASEHFGSYMAGEISEEELKERLGIDKKYEEEVLGIEYAESPLESVKRFAVESGIVVDVSDALAEKVLIEGNEDLWKKYSSGEIVQDELRGELGLDKDIFEMYFDLSKIDIQIIEQKLQDLKARRASAKEMKRNAMTIILYCYIIEGQIACGPKNRIPKGNKRLKIDNLKKFLEAA